MSPYAKETTNEVADLWLGVAKTIVRQAQKLHEGISQAQHHLRIDVSRLAEPHRSDLKRAFYMTSQIALLLREQSEAASNITNAIAKKR